jgi:hypothetical protein
MGIIDNDTATLTEERRAISLEEDHASDLTPIVTKRFSVLIFIPSTNEFQRFVLSGAFHRLAETYELTYVMSPADKAAITPALDTLSTPPRVVELEVPAQRFERWQALFEAACFRYAGKSRSFAMRANLRFNRINPRIVRLLSSPLCLAVSHGVEGCGGCFIRAAAIPRPCAEYRGAHRAEIAAAVHAAAAVPEIRADDAR